MHDTFHVHRDRFSDNPTGKPACTTNITMQYYPSYKLNRAGGNCEKYKKALHLKYSLAWYSHYYGFAGKKNENNALGSPRVKKGIQRGAGGSLGSYCPK